MRRNTAVFLLAVFVLQCFGLHVIGGLKLAEHRSAMRAACKELQPHHKFTAAELASARWIHAREFVLNGRRYDVAAAVKTESGIVYHVIADSREDRLRAQQELLNKQNDQENTGTKHLAKKGVDCSVLSQVLQLNTISENSTVLFSQFHFSGSNFRTSPPDPPPPRTLI
ncbi:MAG: hypothetical protein ACRC3B_06240 [Bacteroidia bacterium]